LELLDRAARTVGFQQTAGHAHRDADGMDDPRRIKAEQLGGDGGASDDTTDRRPVLAALQEARAACRSVIAETLGSGCTVPSRSLACFDE
jgi:hypothetical protein